jgi:hypothetical protein
VPFNLFLTKRDKEEMTVRCWLERRMAMLIASYYAAAITVLPDDEPDNAG